MTGWADIKIVAFEEDNVLPSQKRPGLRRMPLRLSAQAPHEWGRLLERRYASSLSSNKRSIDVGPDRIYVDCPPHELGDILEELKPMVEETNREYAASDEQRRRKQERSDQAAIEERDEMLEIKKRLNFD